MTCSHDLLFSALHVNSSTAVCTQKGSMDKEIISFLLDCFHREANRDHGLIRTNETQRAAPISISAKRIFTSRFFFFGDAIIARNTRRCMIGEYFSNAALDEECLNELSCPCFVPPPTARPLRCRQGEHRVFDGQPEWRFDECREVLRKGGSSWDETSLRAECDGDSLLNASASIRDGVRCARHCRSPVISFSHVCLCFVAVLFSSALALCRCINLHWNVASVSRVLERSVVLAGGQWII